MPLFRRAAKATVAPPGDPAAAAGTAGTKPSGGPAPGTPGSDGLSSHAPASAPPFDPAYGDPDAARLREALAARNWPAARLVLDGREADDLAFLIDVGSAVRGCEEWLPDVVRADLRDTLPLLLYGARTVRWAWDARTDALARDVSRDRFAVFHERLRVAEDCLQDVVRRRPDDTTAWYRLLTVARGLELGRDEARRRFERVVERQPHHAGAHREMLQQLCAKWGGSHELMHAFAEESVAAAPVGNPLGHLVAQAHLEQWVHLGSTSGAYFRASQVAASVNAAADRSVRHPGYRRGPGWPMVHNPFAMVFSVAGDQAAAAEQFRVIGDLATRMPWGHFTGDPRRTYEKRRAIAFARSG